MVRGMTTLDGTFVQGDSGVKHHKMTASRGEYPIKYLILSHTAGSGDVAAAEKTMFNNGASFHWLIGKDGVATQVYQDNHLAYAAGVSYFAEDSGLNKYSVSIMLGNIGRSERKDLYSDKQIKALQSVINHYERAYTGIKILELGEAAPQKHMALGNFFPREAIKTLAEISENINFDCKINFNDSDEQVTIIQEKLKQYGYAIEVTNKFDNQTINVFHAFHRANVAYTKFDLVENDSGIKFYVPQDLDALGKADVIIPDTNKKLHDVTPATPHCWSDADGYVLDQLLSDSAQSQLNLALEGDVLNYRQLSFLREENPIKYLSIKFNQNPNIDEVHQKLFEDGKNAHIFISDKGRITISNLDSDITCNNYDQNYCNSDKNKQSINVEVAYIENNEIQTSVLGQLMADYNNAYPGIEIIQRDLAD